jgi:hypothetical protein
MGKGKERGPGGPGAHPELDGGVNMAGGGPVGAESITAVHRSDERIGDGGGYSMRGSSIASAGKKRAGWRSSGAHRRSRG